ncbi:MAG TPA: zf-HC2 domain-containing protein [Pyrinomonadaceae bacterium]|jgi:hypothetical protein|nr:zf-HC2 domain-containing protein [Pyrinomonadaceae bacterium]
MKCEECQFLIEGYFDGELDQATNALVATHIEGCLSCNSEFEQLTSEHRTYGSYERGLSAAPDLWAKVRTRITEAPLKPATSLPWPARFKIAFSNLFVPRFSVPVSVAVLLFGIVSTVAVMKYLDRKQPTDRIASISQSAEKPSIKEPDSAEESQGKILPVESTPEPPRHLGQRRESVSAAARRATTPSQLVRDAEKNYLNAIALLTRDAAKRPSQLDPEARAKLDEALVSIDRTITATRKAVRKDPNDPLVVQYMLTAYAKKVDVLKELTTY